MFGKAKLDGSRTGGRSRPCTTGWRAPWDMVTPVTIWKKAVISPNKVSHARDSGRDGHCIPFFFYSRPWWVMHGLVLHFPLIITPVMAPSRCPSPITPVIYMEEGEEHPTTPVTTRKWRCSDHHGASSRPWPSLGDASLIITPVTVLIDHHHARGWTFENHSRPWWSPWLF